MERSPIFTENRRDQCLFSYHVWYSYFIYFLYFYVVVVISLEWGLATRLSCKPNYINNIKAKVLNINWYRYILQNSIYGYQLRYKLSCNIVYDILNIADIYDYI